MSFPRSDVSDSFGANTPSTSTTRRTPCDGVKLQGGGRALQRRGIRRRRQRQHLAHQHAQIGVFPVLDPPVRQAQRARRHRTPAVVSIGDLACAGQPGSATARISLEAWAVSVLASTTFITKSVSLRPRLRTGRSRKLPAPAPVPCRRSSRPCPSTSRARNPARCSSTAADNA